MHKNVEERPIGEASRKAEDVSGVIDASVAHLAYLAENVDYPEARSVFE